MRLIHGKCLLTACLLGLVLILEGCGGNKPAALLPDLRPVSLSLDVKNQLVLTLVNEGPGEVPAGAGKLSFFIDGIASGTYDLGSLAQQDWRQPGDTLRLTTTFRLSGANRRVSMVVDPLNEIAEANEIQNSEAAVLDAAPIPGPDFIIHDLATANFNWLTVSLKNQGAAVNAPDLQLSLRVIVNEKVAGDFKAAPGAVPPGGTWLYTPNPAVKVPVGATVKVILNAPSAADDVDNTNGLRQEVLPPAAAINRYQALLENEALMKDVIWVTPNAGLPYPQWNTLQKKALENALVALENGENPGLTEPPVLTEATYMSTADAWQIFIAHVAQSFFVEAHQLTKWKLIDYPSAQRRLILSAASLLSVDDAGRYFFDMKRMGAITAWNPKIAFTFLQEMGMLSGDRKKALYDLAEFMRCHFFHNSGVSYSQLYEYEGQPAFDKLIYARPAQGHVTMGCWGTTGLFNALLRTANIPVQRAFINFGSQHSRPAFPADQLSLVHADDPYGGIFYPSGGVVPAEKFFISFSDLQNNHLSPQPFCDDAGCNSEGDQSSWHHSHWRMQLAFEYKTDYLPYLFATGGEKALDNALQGDKIGGKLVIYKQPFFPTEERAQMITAVKTWLTEWGGGDIEAGKALVIKRYNQFTLSKKMH